MARKSRRTTRTAQKSSVEKKNTSGMELAHPCLKTAIYARLSVDKGEEDAQSLQGQIELIRQYIAVHPEFEIVDVYADLGVSGTTFDRPEFARLMGDVGNGKVQCIVVKDLSRFGRNFLETGYYLENLLLRLNVRFIAINDDYDSTRKADRESLAAPIKNLINEMYAKDFSKKQTAYYEHSVQQGTKIIERSTYGYSLDKKHNRLVPNPETAPIVQMIFRWYLMQYTHGDIARRLNALGIPTPSVYKALYEENKPCPQDRWYINRVKGILCKETYMGDTVHGKRRKILYKNVQTYHANPEDWVIHQNTHEALVTREAFAQAAQLREKRAAQHQEQLMARAERRSTSRDIFPCKVFCKDCGETMHYLRYVIGNVKDQQYGAEYQCFHSKESGKKQCLQTIQADYLKAVVMAQIKVLLKAMTDCENSIKKGKFSKTGKLAGIQAKIENLRYRIDDMEKINATLYESYADGLLEEDYRELKEHYILKKQQLQEELEQATEQKRKMEKTITHFLELTEQLQGYTAGNDLEEKLIDELVEQIDVSAGGSLEIHFKCDDIYADILQMTGTTKA